MSSDNQNVTYGESVAKTYDATREGEAHWKWECDFIAQWFKNKRYERLLDLPVGTGRFLPYYQGVKEIVGVDISQDMLAYAKIKAEGAGLALKTVFETGDVFKLRFARAYFDVAVVIRLLHLFSDNLLPGALGELCRVTKNELIIQVYTPLEGLEKYYVHLRSRISRMFSNRPTSGPETAGNAWSHIPAFYHRESRFEEILKANGFVRAERHELGKYGGINVLMVIYRREGSRVAGS